MSKMIEDSTAFEFTHFRGNHYVLTFDAAIEYTSSLIAYMKTIYGSRLDAGQAPRGGGAGTANVKIRPFYWSASDAGLPSTLALPRLPRSCLERLKTIWATPPPSLLPDSNHLMYIFQVSTFAGRSRPCFEAP